MMDAIKLHKCLACDTFIPETDDICEVCSEGVEADLALHELLTAMGRLRSMPIPVLDKRKELLIAVKHQIQDIEEEIAAAKQRKLMELIVMGTVVIILVTVQILFAFIELAIECYEEQLNRIGIAEVKRLVKIAKWLGVY